MPLGRVATGMMPARYGGATGALPPSVSGVLETCGYCGWQQAVIGPVPCLGCGAPVNGPGVLPPDPLPPPPPERLPDAKLDGEVVGYRTWSLDGHKLGSRNRGTYRWTLGVNKAQCLASRHTAVLRASHPVLGEPAWAGTVPEAIPPDTGHKAPHPDCGCGLYAVYDLAQADRFTADGDQVYGAVVAWGAIEAHWDGFRAEYAKPVVLAYHPDQPYRHVQIVKALAGEFGLPLVEVDQLEEAALDHGQPVPETMRPGKPHDSFEVLGVAVQGFASPHSPSAPKPVSATPSSLAAAAGPGDEDRARWQRNRRLASRVGHFEAGLAAVALALVAYGNRYSLAAGAVCAALAGWQYRQAAKWRDRLDPKEPQ
jgi:hypothetical protein